MTNRYIDGFDFYSTAQLADLGWTATSTGITIDTGTGRTADAMKVTSESAQVNSVYRDFDNQANWTVGFAFKCSALPTINSIILKVMDGASDQVDLYLMTDGTLEVRRNAAVLGTTTTALIAGTFYYLEFEVIINNASGTIQIDIDQATALTLNTLDTQETGNATASRIEFQINQDNNWNYLIDDLYINDGVSGLNNGILGDQQVILKVPVSDGAASLWTPSSGTDHFAMVDETPHDSDTTTLTDQTLGNRELFNHTAVTEDIITVNAVQLTVIAKKTGAGPRSLFIFGLDTSTTAEDSSAALPLDTAYKPYNMNWDENFQTNLPWLKTDFANFEFGFEVAL
ncbi:MAG: hypothetical protein KAJ03_12610 [Gammaproteobacteria bacterium]|nr:hypothetical protein [Gammaproteobacteria bacterium]